MTTLTDLLPIVVLILALWFGPLPIVARGFVRGIAGARHVHQWFQPVGLGLALGACCAAIGSAVLAPGQTAFVVLITLLFFLGSIDWQWRWLPIEWTAAVVALALFQGLITGQTALVLMQMLVPSMALLVFRQLMSWALGKEALGLGDIWLLLGLGGFLSIFETFLVVGLAALLGLIETGLRRVISSDKRNWTGVSYGTHLCIVFVIFLSFPGFL